MSHSCRLRILALCLVPVFFPRADAQAQQTAEAASWSKVVPDVRVMTLEQALAHARDHHPRVQAMRARMAAALEEVAVTRAQWLPQVGAMAQLVASTTNNSSTTLLGNNVVDLPRIGATTVDDSYSFVPAASTAVALGVRQQLFDFGRVAAESAALKLLAEAERHRAESSALDVGARVAQAYFAVLAARGVLDASLAAEGRAKAHGELARAGVKSGLRPPIELTRAEADLARYEVGVLRAAGGLSTARTLFAAACNVPDQELDAAASDLKLPPLEPFEALLERSLTLDPALLGARSRAQAERANAEALGAQTLPRLYATASVSGRAGGSSATNGPVPTGDGFLPVVPNWNVGAVLTWPVYDPINQRRRAVATTRAQAFELEAQDLQRTQRALLGAAYRSAQIAAQTVELVDRSAAAARANYVHAEQRFQVGLGTALELSDAEALRIEADIQLAMARAQAAQSRAQLVRAVGEQP